MVSSEKLIIENWIGKDVKIIDLEGEEYEGPLEKIDEWGILLGENEDRTATFIPFKRIVEISLMEE